MSIERLANNIRIIKPVTRATTAKGCRELGVKSLQLLRQHIAKRSGPEHLTKTKRPPFEGGLFWLRRISAPPQR